MSKSKVNEESKVWRVEYDFNGIRRNQIFKGTEYELWQFVVKNKNRYDWDDVTAEEVQ